MKNAVAWGGCGKVVKRDGAVEQTRGTGMMCYPEFYFIKTMVCG